MALVFQAMALVAHATPTYTITVSPASLGIVTSAATGLSVFRIDPTAGAVTEISGGATLQNAATMTRATVTISCTAHVAGDCTNNVNVTLATIGSPIGRTQALARLTFTMGTAQLAGGPGPPGSTRFTIAPIGANSSKTFFVGADMTIAGDDSGLPTGAAEADFSISIADTLTTGSGTGAFTATVLRSIAITKLTDLNFGTVAQPASGTGSATVDPSSGARTTIGAVGYSSPTPSQASFSVTGEGGQAFSITVPTTIAMTGPQAMTVTTTTSVAGTALLSGSLGSQGSFTFGVGGTIPINSTTPSGVYSGSFTVTVAYN